MKIFIDTANWHDIEEALKRGIIRGITTNPSLLSKEPKADYLTHIAQIVELINRYQDSYRDVIHLSVEVFSQNSEVIIEQAYQISNYLKYRHLSIKVQIGWDELEAITRLSKDGFSVNCTCCMSVNQAVLAASAGAKYVSFFWGRIRDFAYSQYDKQYKEAVSAGILDFSDLDPQQVVKTTREIFDAKYPGVEIIVGSIRKATDIRDAMRARTHIVTVPPKFFKDMVNHFKTEEVVNQFLTDFKNWMS